MGNQFHRLFQTQTQTQTTPSTHRFFINEIVSGGQTGVDRAALDVAIELAIPHGGWCPHQRLAEDGEIPEQYHLQAAPAPTREEASLDPDAVYKKRTELNARDSDGTVIILKEPPIGGTLYTIKMLEKHRKPYLVFNLSDHHRTTEIADWVLKNNIHKLNVAGPRASQTAGIYDSAYQLLSDVLRNPMLQSFPSRIKP